MFQVRIGRLQSGLPGCIQTNPRSAYNDSPAGNHTHDLVTTLASTSTGRLHRPRAIDMQAQTSIRGFKSQQLGLVNARFLDEK